MITFKQQITVAEELVTGLALSLGYTPTLTRQIEVVDDEKAGLKHFEIEEYQNPKTAEEFVNEKSKEHTINFFKPFGEKLVLDELAKLGFDEQKEQAKAQLEQVIIEPVINNLVTEVVTD